MEDAGMVQMFKSLESSVLRGFLGCSSTIYEAALVELFHNSLVRDDNVVSAVQGKSIEISEELFAGTFELPIEGLTEMTDDMVTPASKQARGFAVQICILLNGAPDLELGESKEFPHLKILIAKTVGTYVAKNKNIAVVIPAATTKAQRRRAQKRKLVLKECSDDELVENIIHQVVLKTAGTEPVETESRIDVSAITNDDDALCSKVLSIEEGPVVETEKETEKEKEIEPVVNEGINIAKIIVSTDTDSLSKIPEEMMLPSTMAAEPTKIRFGLGIEIKGVKDGYWYKASLPQIDVADKEKAVGALRRIQIPLPGHSGSLKFFSENGQYIKLV
ncbi:hypothetical protein F511_35838 [Dorcoceras hygrometricum]|uniref:Splicing factor 3B subunit 1-like n=1 Tax=Dorcoceras hygrometricum TaxID=472368 RepID=A0A2Z7ABF6_9LAMI|nr:hypothetical protein F511_35838 [Dorcoceras hygrometricum]